MMLVALIATSLSTLIYWLLWVKDSSELRELAQAHRQDGEFYARRITELERKVKLRDDIIGDLTIMKEQRDKAA